MDPRPASSLPLLVRTWPERRPVVLGAAAVLCATALALAATAAIAPVEVAALAALPVLLVALDVGLSAGLVAAAGGIGVIALAVITRHAAPTAALLGGGALLAAEGAVAGRFGDRLRDAGARTTLLLQAALRIGGPASDTELLRVAADSAMRVADADGALLELDRGASAGVGREAGRRTTFVLDAGRGPIGQLHVWTNSTLGSEPRSALDLVALQAALACEQEIAAERERERYAAKLELDHARQRLSEQTSELAYLVASQESERRDIAFRLHEQLAQALAGVILALDLVTRAPAGGDVPVAEIGRQVTDVLADLRQLATTLRPAALDHLGLAAGLEFLARETHAQGAGEVTVETVELPRPLPKDAETAAYRIVEEAIHAAQRVEADPAIHVRVEQHGPSDGSELRLGLVIPAGAPEALSGISARVRSAGGSLDVNRTNGDARLAVSLPLARSAI